ncbi:MAG: RluA family pseudouridine synthase [Syntrophaceae bacterium]|nr:RluA family pseudouridine synthase [Syntrophaceae bacterium]
MVDQSEKITFTIDKSQAGQRLDLFLAQKDTGLSRSQVKHVVEEGDVLVNGLVPKVSQKLKEGDVVELTLKPAKEAIAVAQDIPLDIVYEDEAIIVVNKPAGMVVHPAAGNPDNTLVNALLFHCKNLSGIGGVIRPGIVHRLDKGTSGLIVAAKTDEAHRNLSTQFEKHEVHKTYEVLVWGDVKGNTGEIFLPVGRHTTDRKKMSTKSKCGKEALTLWKARERYGIATLLDVEIKTGRTHQIRVHLSSRGYGVIGDSVYGGSGKMRDIKDAELKNALKKLNRQALHAAKLSFLHPLTGQRVIFAADMPKDLHGLCQALREFSGVSPANGMKKNWKESLKEF